MVLLLYIIGAISFIGCIIAGFSTGSFVGFLIAAAGGISSAIVFFALAKILENQENILYKLDAHGEANRRFYAEDTKICSSCNYKYEADYKSCPHCGNKQ